jgi:hypothetical protein
MVWGQRRGARVSNQKRAEGAKPLGPGVHIDCNAGSRHLPSKGIVQQLRREEQRCAGDSAADALCTPPGPLAVTRGMGGTALVDMTDSWSGGQQVDGHDSCQTEPESLVQAQVPPPESSSISDAPHLHTG